MKTHVLQHVPFEGLGSIHAWLDARNARLSTTSFFEESWSLPAVDELDLLIVMGGPMSVNDEEVYPWLKDEKRFILEAIRANVPVLGICLGAQLIASALGARVYPGPQKEIGWFTVRAVETNDTAFPFPESVTPFHWHGETFDLPPGAAHLAESDACKHQAFQIGAKVIGLQFHLETTPESADALITHCRHEITPGPFVQDETTILAAPQNRYATIHGLMRRLLHYLTEGVDPGEDTFSPR